MKKLTLITLGLLFTAGQLLGRVSTADLTKFTKWATEEDPSTWTQKTVESKVEEINAKMSGNEGSLKPLRTQVIKKWEEVSASSSSSSAPATVKESKDLTTTPPPVPARPYSFEKTITPPPVPARPDSFEKPTTPPPAPATLPKTPTAPTVRPTETSIPVPPPFPTAAPKALTPPVKPEVTSDTSAKKAAMETEIKRLQNIQGASLAQKINLKVLESRLKQGNYDISGSDIEDSKIPATPPVTPSPSNTPKAPTPPTARTIETGIPVPPPAPKVPTPPSKPSTSELANQNLRHVEVKPKEKPALTGLDEALQKKINEKVPEPISQGPVTTEEDWETN